MLVCRATPVLLLAGACDGRSAARAAPAPVLDGGTEIRAAYLQLEGAFHADQRREVLARLQAGLPELTPRILAAIDDPAGACFAMAAQLAAELGIEAAAARLLEIACDRTAPHRTLAMRASNRLSPVPTVELAALLADGESDLRRAVLAAMAGRPDVPFDAVAALLGLPDVAVAAAAVVPAQLTPEQAAELGDLALAAPATAVGVIRELAKRPLPATVFAAWLDRLLCQTVPVQEAVLAAIAAHPEVSVDRLPRDLVRSSSSAAVSLAALRCLIAANAVDVAWLAEAVRELPRAHRILCGIGLLQLGDRNGAHLLLQLAFAEPADGVAVVARRVLSHAANLPLHHGEQEFAEWCQRAGEVRPEARALLALVPEELGVAADH